MKTILILILLVIILTIFVFLGWSFCNWINGYKDAGVRMSFGEFRRIYELAPSKWNRYGDYTYRRNERIPIPKSDFFGTTISTSIAMRTLFDFGDFFFGWKSAQDSMSERYASKKKRLVSKI